MKRNHLWTRLAHLLVSLALVSGLLLPTTVYADDKGKGNAASAPAQAQKQNDKKEAPKPQASTQTTAPKNEERKDDKPAASTRTESKSAVQTDDRKADQQSAKQVDKPQGHSLSNPDGGGVDKPYGVGTLDEASQENSANTSKVLDGNNGCGQEKKAGELREDDFGQKHIGLDDNQGWCGQKPENVKSTNSDDKVHVKGCYVWNNDKDKPFFINEQMTEEQAKDFKQSTTFISDDMDGCKKSDEQPKVKFVDIKGCYRDTTTGTVKEYDLTMTEDEREVWLKTHVKDTCVAGAVDVKVEPKKVYICHRTGSMTNPFVLIHVSENAEGHDDNDADFKGHPDDIHFGYTLPNNWQELCKLPDKDGETKTSPLGGPTLTSFEGCIMVGDKPQPVKYTQITEAQKKAYESVQLPMTRCQVLGTQDDNPNPGKPESVSIYGCFQKADGTYVHENRTFDSQAEMDAYKASQGYVGIDSSRPNPDQCKNPDRPGNPPEDRRQGPPAEVLGIQTEGPASTIFTTSAVAERESVNPLVVPTLEVDRVITTAEARAQMPALDVPAAREGVLALVSESPAAPAAPQAITRQQQPAPRPATSLLPTTGEPMVDLALLTLGFLGLTLVGLRVLRVGTRRA